MRICIPYGHFDGWKLKFIIQMVNNDTEVKISASWGYNEHYADVSNATRRPTGIAQYIFFSNHN
jgi:hypothetical protein